MRLYVYLCFCFLFLVLGSVQAEVQENGRISGKVTDAKTGEELAGVTVLVEGTSFGAVTDFEGKFMIHAIHVGTHNVVFSYISYKKKIIKGVVVKAHETVHLNVSMEDAANEMKEVVVSAEIKRETASGVLIQQKNALSVSSGVSADIIRKTPDRTTADVMKRISGASVQENRFAIIRGLNDRYNMGLLNGAPLASTESDRKAFSLDIIPASVIDQMSVVKSASPDMPGDFAGGIIQIQTKDIPDDTKTTISVSGQYNSITTFKSGLKGVSGSTDFLGWDDGTRALPSSVPSIQANKSASFTEMVQQTRSFNNDYSFQNIRYMSPNWGLQASSSKRYTYKKAEFGQVFALSYNNTNRYAPYQTNNLNISANAPVNPSNSDGTFYQYENYRHQVIIGGIANFAAKIGKNTKFSWKNLLTVNTEDQTIHQTGFILDNGRRDTTRPDNRAFYNQSSRMYTSQLSGEHALAAGKMKLKYTGGLTLIHRSVPDFRRILYSDQRRQGDTAFLSKIVGIVPDANSYTSQGSGRYFSELQEQMYSASADLSKVYDWKKSKGLKRLEWKTGGLVQYRTRTFQARNFMYTQNSNLYDGSRGDAIKTLDPAHVFANENIDSTTHFLKETTQGSDQYTASSNLQAAYAMLDMRLFGRLRVTGGMRAEWFHQKVQSVSLGSAQKVDTGYVDWLPSVNIIYELTDKINLRASASRTVSRPEFREFALMAFYDINTNAIITGNPRLTRAQIYNYDFKMEYYPTSAQLISINPFYKQFINPVEIAPGTGPTGIYSFSYMNSDKAVSYGIEFETRLQFGLMKAFQDKPIIKNTTLFANYAWISSHVHTMDNGIELDRPLQGQSPYVFNAGLMYTDPETSTDFSITANRVGNRIAVLGQTESFMIWEKARTVIDLSIQKTIRKNMSLRAVLGDVLAQDLVFFQDINKNNTYDVSGDVTNFKYKFGRTIAISYSYTF